MSGDTRLASLHSVGLSLGRLNRSVLYSHFPRVFSSLSRSYSLSRSAVSAVSLSLSRLSLAPSFS